MLDKWLEDFERMREHGAVVLVKLDGERTSNVYTFVITRVASDYSYRRDTDDLDSAIRDGVAHYWTAHQPRG